jgi:isopropylmalate/homocitrate/citramalate synthase
MEKNLKQRWYDLEPTLSLAVGMMEKASSEKQLECAKLIKEKAKDFGISIAQNKLEEAFNYFRKRWYDKDKELADAFQYLKIMPFELQKEVSLEIISKLENN